MPCCGKSRKQFQTNIAQAKSRKIENENKRNKNSVILSREERIKLRQEKIRIRNKRWADRTRRIMLRSLKKK